MIIVDFTQVMYANIFAHSKGSAITDVDLLRHMVVNSLRKLKERYGREYGKMVLCFDASNAWRHDYFDYYKAARKAKRAEAPAEDMQAMFDFMSTIQKELVEFSPYPCLRVERAEADDIIATLAWRCEENNEKCLIASNDHDFFQLHSEYVSQYLSKTGKIVCCDDPVAELHDKIASGDSSDGIPNVLSDDDTFMNPSKRQKPLRAGAKQQIIAELTHDMLVEKDNGQLAFAPTVSGKVTPQVKVNWDRNNRLINLDMMPDEIQDAIRNEFDQACLNKYHSGGSPAMTFMNYMNTHNMKLMADETQTLMIGE